MKKNISIALLLITLVISIITAPEIALHSAKTGFSIWWSYLFPVLLPMYMLLTLSHALGLFHSTSYVLITLFRLPHTTVDELVPFVYRWFVGATYLPYDNRLEATLPRPLTRTQKLKYILLYTLSYNANPIFVIVVLFTVFVPLSLIGIYIVLGLVCTTLLFGLFVRLHYINKGNSNKHSMSLIQSLEYGRVKDGRPIGKLLGEGIYESVQQLFLLGGVMLFASVVAGYMQELLPHHTSFQFTYIIEQHIAAYSILNSDSSPIMMLIVVVIVLSSGGIVQLLIMYGNFQRLQLNFFSFIRYRIIFTLINFSFILVNIHWLKQAFQSSTTRHVFDQFSLADLNERSQELAMTSTLVTSSIMLTVLVSVFSLIFLIQRRNKA